MDANILELIIAVNDSCINGLKANDKAIKLVKIIMDIGHLSIKKITSQ